jgi:membrane protein CcdC involved in cytochrome C biogenesis
MNRVLKYAWYQLIVMLTAMLYAGVLVWIMATYWRGKEVSAVIILGPFALIHLFKVFFPLKAGKIEFDERDVTIKTGATLLSFTVFWYVFALSCLVPILVIGNGSIHVMYLGGLLLVAVVLFRITWSIAVIVQYGRGGNGSKDNKQMEGKRL